MQCINASVYLNVCTIWDCIDVMHITTLCPVSSNNFADSAYCNIDLSSYVCIPLS